jgi:serine/threonine-protein kinase
VRPWAEVSVDGRVIGTTPLDRISLPAGSHLIVLRHPGYEELRRTVTLRSGETAKLVVDLPKEGTPKRP